MFNDWWNEIIFDDKKNKFTRRDIVTYVANQDGGAHAVSFRMDIFIMVRRGGAQKWNLRMR